MSGSFGRSAFQLGFQISPIILTGGIISGGITSAFPSSFLPIVAITEAANFTAGLLSGGTNLNLDDFFCHFQPLPGGTLIDQQIGSYPFANQSIAANSTISQPLHISMKMICPIKSPFGYLAKLATITALKATLEQHNSQGGTFIVATPSFIYTNCILTSMRDITNGQGAQSQVSWQMDFIQPLLSLSQAAQAYGTAMSKIANGWVTDGSLSGGAQSAGVPGVLGQVPLANNLPGTGFSGVLNRMSPF